MLGAEAQAAVERILLERLLAKRTREFERADALRLQLGELGVMVDDAARVYRLAIRKPTSGAAHGDRVYSRNTICITTPITGYSSPP